MGYVALAAIALLGCGADGMDMGGAFGAPGDPGVPSSPPGTPAPTGSKWVGVEITGECGRTSLAWMAVDEMCGATDDPAYLDSLRAPMFRDGALIGSSLFTVDATHLWVLDVNDPTATARQALVAGLDHPIAVGKHADRLLVAAGDAGLVVLDVTLAADPKPIAQLALPGPALDVTVDGDRALIPMGTGGVAVVNLLPTPTLATTVATPGFAVGIAAAGNVGYVAACDTFAAVDLESGALLGQQWMTAYDSLGVLVAPAKDVSLVGTTAYVAAGRHGAVALDVGTPAFPQVLGQCTLASDLSFYASGVRADGDTLYIAGGEYGILPVDISQPGACSALLYPTMPQQPSGSDACSDDPPWTIVNWQDQWAPPPPTPPSTPVPQAGKDPVQVLPAGDVIYAFGDARRLGVRAVDIRSTTSSDLPKLGRYEEPRLLVDMAAKNGRLLVLGEKGGVFAADDSLLLAPLAAPTEVKDGIAATALDDGRWAFVTSSALHVENELPRPLLEIPPWHGVSAVGSKVVIAETSGAHIVDIDAGTETTQSALKTAALPPAIVARPDGIFMAAPEWDRAVRMNELGTTSLAQNNVFGAEEILDANLWREGLPRRLLADSPYGVIEIATLGKRAGLTVHGPNGADAQLALPSGTYIDAAAQGNTLYLVLSDRNIYRSSLITVTLTTGSAQIAQTDTFTGVGMAVAVDGPRLYVGDGDRGVRVYALTSGLPTELGVYELGGMP